MNSPTQEITYLDPDLIRPGRYQFRQHFDPIALEELASSIRSIGLSQPPVVRRDPQGGHYELLAGERRWRACMLAQLEKIPVIVRAEITEDEALTLGVVENIQRQSLSCIEEARAFQFMSEQGATHTEIGRKVGKSRAYVTNSLRLLALDAFVQQVLIEGAIELGHAKVLLGTPKPAQARLARETARRHLSVRALERRVKELNSQHGEQGGGAKASPRKSSDVAHLERALSEFLGAVVKIEYSPPKGCGQISVAFHSLEAFDGLLDKWGFEPAD